MTTKALHAYVIHKQWSGETSARVSFFTLELGLINCLCKGGRTPKKQSLLQAFTPLWVAVDERYERYYAKTIESVSPMLDLTGHSLFSGLYVNELLFYALKPLDPDEQLFASYLTTLNSLEAAKDKEAVERILRRFEWSMLHSLGHSFAWTNEAKTEQPIEANRLYQFMPGDGFIQAEQGIPGEHLLALARDDFTELTYLKSAKMIMRQAIDHLLGGKEIKARSLYL